MKTYRVSFKGLRRGSSGRPSSQLVSVEAEKEEAVQGKLAETYDRVSNVKINEANYSVYHDLVRVMAPTELDHHESDLYVLLNEKSRPIIEKYVGSVTSFKSNLDGKLWYDLPFAFAPFWEKAQSHAADLSRSVPRKATRKKSAPRLSR